MHSELLNRLVDPVDGLPLALERGELRGPSGRGYRIYRGIPRFVPDEQYAGSFSFEWRIHRRTKLDDADSDESRRSFLERTGFDEALMRGARVLDAGVGSGRYADIALKLGAAEVIGLDLSLAVESAQENLGRDPRFGVVQADVFAPPFADESFDLIYSIGVLHHTPAPRLAFERLVRLLRPGGRIAVHVYVDSPTHLFSDVIRLVTTRLPPAQLYRLVTGVQPILDGLSRSRAGRAFMRWLPQSGHPRADWRVLDNFDWYSPRYQHRYRGAEEVADWFRHAGLVDVRPHAVPICLSGRKPISRAPSESRVG
jgi:SAM-dependent methyltransferase